MFVLLCMGMHARVYCVNMRVGMHRHGHRRACALASDVALDVDRVGMLACVCMPFSARYIMRLCLPVHTSVTIPTCASAFQLPLMAVMPS